MYSRQIGRYFSFYIRYWFLTLNSLSLFCKNSLLVFESDHLYLRIGSSSFTITALASKHDVYLFSKYLTTQNTYDNVRSNISIFACSVTACVTEGKLEYILRIFQFSVFALFYKSTRDCLQAEKFRKIQLMLDRYILIGTYNRITDGKRIQRTQVLTCTVEYRYPLSTSNKDST